MANPFQTIAAKVAAGAVIATALVAMIYWLRSGIVPRIGNADEGEFLLVEASERELDGSPALSLTFTLPLDARQSYDKYIRVFEMPAPPRRPDERRFNFEEERPGTGGTIVSTQPEDTKADGGNVMAGAGILRGNPRVLLFSHIKAETRYVVTVCPGLAAGNDSNLA